MMPGLDDTPPILSFISLPGSINVGKGNQTARFTAGATDEGSGVYEVAFHLNHSIRSGGISTNYITFTNDADFRESGRSTVQQEVDSSTGAGTYTIDQVDVLDKAGHITTYYAGELATMGLDTQFTVKSRSTMDVTPPTLTSLALPKTVNVTNGDKLVSFTAGAMDSGSGVKSVLLSLDHAIQSHGQAQSTLSFDAGSDDFTDGRSILSQQIDSTTGAGTYRIDHAWVTDNADNTRSYSAAELESLGMGTRFTVKSQAVLDATPPQLSVLSLPKTINLTKGDQTVTFKVGASDTNSGVQQVFIHFDHAIQVDGKVTDSLYFGATDDFADGRSAVSVTIDHATAAGNYSVDYAGVTDKAGNTSYYGVDDLAALGLNTHFVIRNNATLVGQSVQAFGQTDPATTAGWLHPSIGQTLEHLMY